jgi:SNF2 family DNA or RNA helicase
VSYLTPVTPYKHQDAAQYACLNKPKRPTDRDVFAFLMEQGTGKTKVIFDEFGMRESARDLRNMLVIAPKGCVYNWPEVEMPVHMSADLKERTSVFAWRAGEGSGYMAQLNRFLKQQDRPRIFVCNVEALSTTQAAVDACAEFLKARRTLMVIDESTCIKGVSTRTSRVRSVLALGKLAYARRILTGLVSPRSPLDLFSQFDFLDYRIIGFQSYYAFRARYAIIKKKHEVYTQPVLRGANGAVLTNENGEVLRKTSNLDVVVGYRHVEELNQRIAPYMFRVVKDDCLDLPPKIYVPPWRVELTPEQKRILKELKTTAMAKLDSGEYVSTQIKIVTILRMHQVLCGHVRHENQADNEDPVPVKSNRLSALLDILGGHSGKALIWSGYRYSIKEIVDALRREYGAGSVVSYFGGTSDSDRSNAVRRFQNDANCRWFVASQSSAGKGLTLHAASLCVFYSNTYNLEERMQSEDRAHRAGLKHSVSYIDLMSEDAIEKKLVNALRKKLDLATEVMGDRYREWIV